MADTEQEGTPPATAGGAPAPILDLSAFEKAGRLLAAAWLEQQAARAAYWRGLFGGLSANQEPHAMQEVDRSTCPNCWGDLPPDPRDAEIERLRITRALNVPDGTSVTAIVAEIDRRQGVIGRQVEKIRSLQLEVASARSIADEKRAVAEKLRGQVDDLSNERDDLAERLEAVQPAREAFRKQLNETDRLRAELCRIRDIALIVLNVLPDDDDRSAVDLVREILESAGPEKLRRDNQFRGLVAERDRKRRELGDVTADRDRWQALYNQLIGDALHVQQHLQRALCKPVPADEEFDRAYSRSMVGELAAQRDRLRQDLDFIARQPQGNNPYWQQRSKRVEDERDVMAEALVAVRHVVATTEARLTKKPAEPRRWTVGDPEPEIGTTVDPGGDAVTYTRRNDGSWHRNSCECGMPLDCDSSGHWTWTWMTARYAELVEVVDRG